MTSHYTPKTFLRQVSHKLLGIYLAQAGIDLGIDVAELKPRSIDPIIDAINRLPDEQRATLDRDLHAIWSLASEAGLRHILDEATDRSVDIVDRLQPHAGFLNKAILTFVEERAVFDGAARFAILDMVSGRYWKRGLPVAGASVHDIGSRTQALEAVLSEYFQREECRGKSCKIDHVARGARHCFFAYPEDYTSMPLAWTDAGLGPHRLRPAFEVIFVYDSQHGSLDIYFHGTKRTIDRLCQLFADVVLGIPELPPTSKPAYGLQGLKSRDFAFIRPVDSPVTEIKVKRLGFVIPGGPPMKVGVEVDLPGDTQAVHKAVDRVFERSDRSSGRIPLSLAKVINAKLCAIIDPRDGGKPRARSFDVSEKSCSLKYEGNDLLLRQVLLDSGIDLTGRPGDAGGREARPASQLAAE